MNLRRAGRGVVVVALAWLALGASPTSAQTPGLRWTAEAVADLAEVREARIAPGGRSVVFALAGWCGERRCSNLWQADLAGGEPWRLTSGDGEDAWPRWSPDGSRLAFLSRRLGPAPARGEVLVRDESGRVRRLDGVPGDALAVEWSRDGTRLACLARDDGRPRLWLVDVSSGRISELAALGDRAAGAFAWGPDGSAIAAAVGEPGGSGSVTQAVAVLPLAGAARVVADGAGPVTRVGWSGDGRAIAWIADVNGRATAFVVSAAGGVPRSVPGVASETALDVAWRSDGRIAIAIGAGLQTRIDVVDLASGAREVVLPSGLASIRGAMSWADPGEPFAVVGSTPSAPAEVFSGLMPREVPSKPDWVGAPPPPVRAVTRSNPWLDGLPRGPQEIVHYRAPDGADVEALLVRPVSERREARHPLVVVALDGGVPLRDGWVTSARIPARAFAERGAFVLLVGSRGSGGDEAPALDLRAGIDHLVGQGEVDPKRVGVLVVSPGAGTTRIAALRGALATHLPLDNVTGSGTDQDERSARIANVRRLLGWLDARLLSSGGAQSPRALRPSRRAVGLCRPCAWRQAPLRAGLS